MKTTSVIAIIVLVTAGIGLWKYKSKSSGVNQLPAVAEARPYEADAKVVARITEEVAALADEAKRLPFAPEQSDLMSNYLPSLPWRQMEIDLSKQRLQAISAKSRELVVGKLKDPESARFKDSKVLAVADGRGHRYFFCGLVNAKNSYGGYTGNSDYVFEVKADSLDSLSGGVGDEGQLEAVKFDERWWKYEADDACLLRGIPIE